LSATFSTEAELATNRQQLLVDGRTLTRQRRFRDYDASYQVIRGEINGRFQLGKVCTTRCEVPFEVN
jgi:iron complex outermembrane receptor protein